MSADHGAALIGRELRAMIAAVTGSAAAASAEDSTPLLGDGLALSSLAATMLLRAVQRRFGVDVAGEDLNLDAMATVGTLAAYVTARAGQRGTS